MEGHSSFAAGITVKGKDTWVWPGRLLLFGSWRVPTRIIGPMQPKGQQPSLGYMSIRPLLLAFPNLLLSPSIPPFFIFSNIKCNEWTSFFQWVVAPLGSLAGAAPFRPPVEEGRVSCSCCKKILLFAQQNVSQIPRHPAASWELNSTCVPKVSYCAVVSCGLCLKITE